MINNENDFDKELLLKEYELNMSDHDRKEKMAWLASTLYYTFCIAVIGFILSNKNLQHIDRFLYQINNEAYYIIIKLFIIIILISIFFIIFACVLSFIDYQYNRKEKTDKYIELLQDYIKVKIKDKELFYLLKYKLYCKDKPKNKAKISIYFILYLLFIIKIFIIIIFFFIYLIY